MRALARAVSVVEYMRVLEISKLEGTTAARKTREEQCRFRSMQQPRQRLCPFVRH